MLALDVRYFGAGKDMIKRRTYFMKRLLWIFSIFSSCMLISQAAYPQSTNVFTVFGEVFDIDGVTYVRDGCKVTVINLSKLDTLVAITGEHESGKYDVVFADIESNQAASVGDTIIITLHDPEGDLVATPPPIIPSSQSIMEQRLRYDITAEAQVSTMLQSHHVTLKGDHIEVFWEVSPGGQGISFKLIKFWSRTTYFKAIPQSAIDNHDNMFYYRDYDIQAGGSYCYRIEFITEGVSHVYTIGYAAVPTRRLILYQNYPNPFSFRTAIPFFLPQKAYVSLSVYNSAGKMICELSRQSYPEGLQEVAWNGTDVKGKRVGSGVYYYVLKVGSKTLIKKMTLLR
jgi:hypothetical protein